MLRRGKAGRSGRGVWRNVTRCSASMIVVIEWTAFTVPSRRPMCPVTPYVWIAMCTMPECTVTRWSAAERLGDHRGVGAEAAFHQVVRALAALRLAGDAGDDEIAGQPHARSADGLGGHDDAGQAALHVLHAVTVQTIPLERRRPRIAPPAPGERVDVGVAVQHEAGAAARTGQRGDRLQASGLDLLEVDLVPALTEELLEKPRDGCLLGLEARDADERAGQVDQLSPIDAFQYRARQLVHEGGAGPRSE